MVHVAMYQTNYNIVVFVSLSSCLTWLSGSLQRCFTSCTNKQFTFFTYAPVVICGTDLIVGRFIHTFHTLETSSLSYERKD